jgi:Mrp family chromosome partitioning ATPase
VDVNPPSPAVEAGRPQPSANPPALVGVVEAEPAIVDAASAALPATPAEAESPSLDPHAFDLLEVVGAEQASVAAMLAPQQHSAPQEAPAVAKPTPHAKLAEPTRELRELAAFLLERFTPGVSTVVALLGCEATLPGAQASLALAAAVADATGVSTLIVDGDFVNRNIRSGAEFAAASGFAEAPGFAEALAEPAKGRSYAQSVGRENLSLLPAGNALPDTSEAPARVAAWIAKAKQEYGLILVWLGVGEGDFARRLYGAADATLLLAAVDHDRPSRIEAASERLRSSNARTLGVALVR